MNLSRAACLQFRNYVLVIKTKHAGYIALRTSSCCLMFRDCIIRTNTQVMSRNDRGQLKCGPSQNYVDLVGGASEYLVEKTQIMSRNQLKCEVLQNDINLRDLRFCHVTKVTSSDVELTLSRNESDQLKCGD